MRNKNQEGLSQKPIIFVILLITTAFISFMFGKNIENKKALKDQSTLKNLIQVSTPKDRSSALPALLDTNGPKKNLILATNISQVLRGTLSSFTTNSWTLKYGQETLSITQQVSTQKIAYFITNRRTNKTIPAKATDLKAGDYVNIITQYLPKEGKIAVTSIAAYRE